MPTPAVVPPVAVTPLTPDQHQQFLALACRLSPENIACDGEISRAAANRRYRAAVREWRALEKQVGRTVDESEVWAAARGA